MEPLKYQVIQNKSLNQIRRLCWIESQFSISKQVKQTSCKQATVTEYNILTTEIMILSLLQQIYPPNWKKSNKNQQIIQIRNHFNGIIIYQMQKNIILIVDNRAQQQNSLDISKNLFRGSAFIATEVDPQEKNQVSLDQEEENSYLMQLQERILVLEQRVKQLEKSSREDKLKRRIRRKASQISRQFKCPHKDCQKFYGSETSLKNHLKIKHSRRGQKNLGNDC